MPIGWWSEPQGHDLQEESRGEEYEMEKFEWMRIKEPEEEK